MNGSGFFNSEVAAAESVLVLSFLHFEWPQIDQFQAFSETLSVNINRIRWR